MNISKLHQVIKSLSKEEKRSFKLSAQKYSSSKRSSYLEVFDYLDKHPTLDKQKFKAKFKDIKGLSGVQNYLYKQLLKSLRTQTRTQENVSITLAEGLVELEILHKKGLVYLAKEKQEELLELAELHDQINFLPLLYDWWFKLENSKFQYYQVDEASMQQHTTKYQQILQTLQLYGSYKIHTGEALFALKDQNSRQVYATFQTLKKNLPTYQTLSHYTSLSTQISNWSLRRFIAAVLRNIPELYQHAQAITNRLEQLPEEVQQSFINFYQYALGTQMRYAPSLDKLYELLQVFTGNPNKLMRTDPHQHLSTLITQVDWYLLSRKFEAIAPFLIEIAPDIAKIKSLTPKSSFMLWHYRMVLYHYSIQQYEQALAIIDLQLIQKEVDDLFRINALLIKMIIYYEEEAFMLLASFLNNFRRFLSRHDALLLFERKLLSLMNKLVKLPKSEHKAIMQVFKDELTQYLKTAPKHEKEALTFFNYMGWLDSQINQTEFETLYYRHVGLIPY